MPVSNSDGLRAEIEEALFYRDGQSIRGSVQRVGEKNTPKWLRIGCLGTFSIPIVGGVIGVIQALSTRSPEMAIVTCAGSLGLLFIALGISKVAKKDHS